MLGFAVSAVVPPLRPGNHQASVSVREPHQVAILRSYVIDGEATHPFTLTACPRREWHGRTDLKPAPLQEGAAEACRSAVSQLRAARRSPTSCARPQGALPPVVHLGSRTGESSAEFPRLV